MAAIPDGYKDILQKKAFANLATVNTDGTPQVTPVWVDYDGTHVRFNTAKGRVKDQNLRRNPAVALVSRVNRSPILKFFNKARLAVFMLSPRCRFLPEPANGVP